MTSPLPSDAEIHAIELAEEGTQTMQAVEEEVVEETTVKAVSAEGLSRREKFFTSGWNKQVSVFDLVSAGILQQNTIDQLETGEIEEHEVEKSIKQYLVGEEPVAGVIITETGETLTLQTAYERGLLKRSTVVSLLEAQAATGRIIN